MESLLDDAAACRGRDSRGMLEMIDRLPEQLEEALDCVAAGTVPEGGRFDDAVLCGMGGSAIGGDLVRAWLGARLNRPLGIHRGPLPPAHLGPRSLAMVCSYSGDTRETLAAFEAARASGARVVCLSSGGELEKRARQTGCVFVRLPAGLPPRAAVAFTTLPLAGLLFQAGLTIDAGDEIRAAARWLKGRRHRCAIGTPTSRNPAKRLAARLEGRLPVFYGGQDRLSAVAVRWAGQFSENAKHLSFAGALPEMTHNDVVGWRHPAPARERLTAVFLRDHDDPPPIGRQIELLRRQFGPEVDCLEIATEAEAPWPARLWDLLWLGDYASVYLAFLNGEDPTPVHAIDRLKNAMKTVEAAKPQ